MNNESTIYSEVLDAMGMPLDLLIFEGIAAVISLGATTLILIASLKIHKTGDTPGGKQILGSLLGSIVITLVSASYAMYSDEVNNIIVGTFEIIVALLFFLGASGFLKLAKYLKGM
ncbi:MAG: hypothetical protein HYZ31_04135 [Gammaproteobacteria bacterium]|nr:hypothetical protein [Gammaproteobacteria bacterium]